MEVGLLYCGVNLGASKYPKRVKFEMSGLAGVMRFTDPNEMLFCSFTAMLPIC